MVPYKRVEYRAGAINKGGTWMFNCTFTVSNRRGVQERYKIKTIDQHINLDCVLNTVERIQSKRKRFVEFQYLVFIYCICFYYICTPFFLPFNDFSKELNLCFATLLRIRRSYLLSRISIGFSMIHFLFNYTHPVVSKKNKISRTCINGM